MNMSKNSKELHHYIRSLEMIGKNREDILSTLREKGFSKAEIEEHSQLLREKKSSESKNLGIILITIGCLFLLVAICTWGNTSYSHTGRHIYSESYYYIGGVIGGIFLILTGIISLNNTKK